MKKILLSTIVLFAFSLSIIVFEISCKKTANADSTPYTLPIATTSKLGGVIPDGTTISVDGTGKISTVNTSVPQQSKILYIDYSSSTIFTANYDGTNPQKLNIVLPTGLSIGDHLSLSPDRKTIFFDVLNVSSNQENMIYTCNIDGSNPHQIVSASDGDINVEAAY